MLLIVVVLWLNHKLLFDINELGKLISLCNFNWNIKKRGKFHSSVFIEYVRKLNIYPT